MQQFTAEQIRATLAYAEFVPFLRQFFVTATNVPDRAHHDLPNATLLLMPAWNDEFLGVKIATVHPENEDLPSIHATYFLQSAKTGEPLATFEGKALTARRTAAASALAASYLARADAKKLLLVGNGALAPELIEAHASVRPIEAVRIWGRNPANVEALIEFTGWQGLQVERAVDLREAVQWADIISCATLTKTPLLHGDWLRPGQHVDLVGSFKPDMREADDAVLRRARIFIDTPMALRESGDLAIPLKNGVIQKSDIRADLASLCTGTHVGRSQAEEITVFKSVGVALEDLAAAAFIFQKRNYEYVSTHSTS